MSELFEIRATLAIIARSLFDQEELENDDPKTYGDFGLAIEGCSRNALRVIESLDQLDSSMRTKREKSR